MQEMPSFFSRLCAKTMPAVMAAGRAGGTVMVMISSDLMMIVAIITCRIIEQHQQVIYYEFSNKQRQITMC